MINTLEPSWALRTSVMLRKLFKDLSYRFDVSEVFTDFLDYALLVMKWQDQQRDFSYYEKKYEQRHTLFQQMLDQLSIESNNAGEGMKDALGDFFMDEISHGRNGQYFTPQPMCDMMALMTSETIENNQVVNDPTCGSGRMLLALGKLNRNAIFIGSDIDMTCCKMAVVNMFLNTMRGEITCMDALTMDFRKAWQLDYKNIGGCNVPFWVEINNKEDSFHFMNQTKSATPAVKTPVPNKKIKPVQLALFQ